MKLCFFFCGTWSTQHGDNTISNLYTACTESEKYIYDGPGSDWYNPSAYTSNSYYDKARRAVEPLKRILTSISGGLCGFMGENNWYHSIAMAMAQITRISAGLSDDEGIEIFLYGWSRGAVACFALINLINSQIPSEIRSKITVTLFAIDPVPGSWLDRYDCRESALNVFKLPAQEVLMLSGVVYYSDSGNMNVLDNRMRNTPCFSGLFVNDPRLSCYLLRANHEEIAAQNMGQRDPTKFDFSRVEQWAAQLVYLSIARRSILNGVSFANPFKESVNSCTPQVLERYQSRYKSHPYAIRRMVNEGSRYKGNKIDDLVNGRKIKSPTQSMIGDISMDSFVENESFNSAHSEAFYSCIGMGIDGYRPQVVRRLQGYNTANRYSIGNFHTKRVEVLIEVCNQATSVSAVLAVLKSSRDVLRARPSQSRGTPTLLLLLGGLITTGEEIVGI